MRQGCALALLVGLAVAPCRGEDWTRFRGPNGAGIASDSGYPVELDQRKNLLWRTPVRLGNSSPVLSKRHVFLTGEADGKLFTQCFDRKTGKLVWERSVPRVRQEIAHQRNGAASNSPVTDGENVYALFRDYGLVSYDTDGEPRWKVPLGPFDNFMGLSSSLILHEDALILLVDRLGDSYIASYRTSNGELNWKADRGRLNGWSTPILYQPDGDEMQIVTSTGDEVNAHLASTGELAWVQPGLAPAVTPSPVMLDDTVYAFGYGRPDPAPFSNTLASRDKDGDGRISPAEYAGDPWLTHIGTTHGGPGAYVTEAGWKAEQVRINKPSSLVAVRLDESGANPRVLWRYQRSFVGVTPSPIVLDGLLYIIKSGGILTTFDAETGEVVKAGRIGALASFWASPVAAEGRLYFAGEDGRIVTVEAGRDWRTLAVSSLEEPILATPALSGGRIYIRTESNLYCFGESSDSSR